MKALIDLDVLLDVTLNRPAFVKESALAFGHLVSLRNSRCYVAQHAVTTLFDIVRKQCGSDCARLTVRKVLKVLPVSQQTLMEAADSRYADYEDAVSFLSAAAADCDLILTRNQKDFALSPVPAKTPHDFLRRTK